KRAELRVFAAGQAGQQHITRQKLFPFFEVGRLEDKLFAQLFPKDGEEVQPLIYKVTLHLYLLSLSPALLCSGNGSLTQRAPLAPWPGYLEVCTLLFAHW